MHKIFELAVAATLGTFSCVAVLLLVLSTGTAQEGQIRQTIAMTEEKVLVHYCCLWTDRTRD